MLIIDVGLQRKKIKMTHEHATFVAAGEKINAICSCNGGGARLTFYDDEAIACGSGDGGGDGGGSKHSERCETPTAESASGAKRARSKIERIGPLKCVQSAQREAAGQTRTTTSGVFDDDEKAQRQRRRWRRWRSSAARARARTARN